MLLIAFGSSSLLSVFTVNIGQSQRGCTVVGLIGLVFCTAFYTCTLCRFSGRDDEYCPEKGRNDAGHPKHTHAWTSRVFGEGRCNFLMF